MKKTKVDKVCGTSEGEPPDPGTDDSMKPPDCINLQEINQTVTHLNSKISSLKRLPLPTLQRPEVQQVPLQTPHGQSSLHAMHDLKTNTEQSPVLVHKTIHQQNNSLTKFIAPSANPFNKNLQQSLNGSHNEFEAVTRTERPGITEWLLPSNICQTRIYLKTKASNACTIIATLCCRNVFNGRIVYPIKYGRSNKNN